MRQKIDQKTVQHAKINNQPSTKHCDRLDATLYVQLTNQYIRSYHKLIRLRKNNKHVQKYNIYNGK